MEELIGTHESGQKKSTWMLTSLRVLSAVILGTTIVAAYLAFALWREWSLLAIFGWAILAMILLFVATIWLVGSLDPHPDWAGPMALGASIPYLVFLASTIGFGKELFLQARAALPFEPAWLGVAAVGLILIFKKTGRFLVIAGLLLWIGLELSSAA